MKPSKPFIRTFAALLFAAMLAATSGCFVVAAGAAGAGTVAFIRGELETTLSGSYETVVAASNSAIGQLQFSKVRETRDAFTAELIARTAQDKKISIKLTKMGEDLTKVQIRIGVFGDEEKSRAILDSIKQNL